MTWPERWDIECLDSITKYPSIPSYHEHGDRGRLTEELSIRFEPEEEWEATEKMDGVSARIILTPYGWLLGSRDQLLTHEHDVVRNPRLRICETLVPLVQGFDSTGQDSIVCVYGEVYGGHKGELGKRSHHYAPNGETGFRVFDVVDLCLREAALLFRLPLQKIAQWRDVGNQPFQSRGQVQHWCSLLRLEHVPLLTGGTGKDLPKTLAESYEFLTTCSPQQSRAGLLGQSARPEGLVIRNPSRTKIAKLRFEDYERTSRVETTVFPPREKVEST